jgi:hypothetical protein
MLITGKDTATNFYNWLKTQLEKNTEEENSVDVDVKTKFALKNDVDMGKMTKEEKDKVKKSEMVKKVHKSIRNVKYFADDNLPTNRKHGFA